MNKDLEIFKYNMAHFGFIVPKNAEFFLVKNKENKGRIGMKVGGYSHSCHVDSTDFIVLFFINDKCEHFVNSYDDFWDIEKIS